MPTDSPTAVSHTPGPYTAEIDGASPVKIVTADRQHIIGYAIYGPRGDVDVKYPGGVATAEANANLFAAAPDLLAACRELVAARSGDGWVIGNVGMAARLAEAAIAKAEGRASE